MPAIHRHLLTLISGALVVALSTAPAAAAPVPEVDPAATSPLRSPFVPGEVIVRFESGASAADRLQAREAADAEYDRSLEVPRAQVVEVDGSVAAAVRRLENQPDVAYAQPNYRYHALAVGPPNDTFFASLWGLQDSPAPNPGVDALEAWETTRGAGQVIAVADTGVALNHPDLKGNLWTGLGGVHGYDFVDGDSDPDDYDFHGTHVAGTIAAIAGNAAGVAGVAPEARIMAVRVLDGDGSGSSADIASGIAYAAQQGADVVNLSLGGPAGVTGDQLMSNAIAVANTHGTVVVAAAGNDGVNNDATPTTPCTLSQPNLVCVAAVTQSGALASFSNYGASTVDLGAPGTSILSARTDYDALFSEGFDSASLSGWDRHAPSGIQWGAVASVRWAGTHSAADSPGGNYAPNSNSQLIRSEPVNLTAERGCRMHFRLRHDIQPPAPNGTFTDRLFAGAVGGGSQAGRSFAGSSNGVFRSTEVSVAALGGRAEVYPAFALFSNATAQHDGAYVDSLEFLCRADTHVNSTGPSGNYVLFQGTSMATPHVAGVVALVRAAALDAGEDASTAAVIDAVLEGTRPLASLNGKTVTGGTADAARAISEVLGLTASEDEPPTGGGNPSPAPAPSPGSAPGAGTPSPSPSPPFTNPAPSSFPSAPRLQVKARIRVKRSRFSIRFAADPGLSASAVVRTARKARVGARGSRRRHLTIERRRLGVPSSGKAALRIRLSRREMRVLRLNGRLRLRVRVTVRDSAGKTATAGKRILLLAPRR